MCDFKKYVDLLVIVSKCVKTCHNHVETIRYLIDKIDKHVQDKYVLLIIINMLYELGKRILAFLI